MMSFLDDMNKSIFFDSNHTESRAQVNPDDLSTPPEAAECRKARRNCHQCDNYILINTRLKSPDQKLTNCTYDALHDALQAAAGDLIQRLIDACIHRLLANCI